MGSGHIEENPKNPTIVKVKKINCPHYFILKYKSEYERLKFLEMVISFVKTYELKDFHIEEKKAFLDSKIFYNFHTLAIGNQFTFDELEKKFLEHFHT